MNILVVGSGGREHALAWKLGQGAGERKVYVAPGSDAIAVDPDIDAETVAISHDEPGAHERLAEFAEEWEIDLTVVGPEGPLCDGLVDLFRQRGLPIFGPRKAAARLEGSKSFAKEIMTAAGVPTADYDVFDELDPALDFIDEVDHPVAIKADGLAGGKGVVLSEDVETSRQTLVEYMEEERFGDASTRVVIEEFLVGEEASFIVVTDGEAVVPLTSSRDHKRIGEGDTGPNTGGMGAIVPAPAVDDELQERLVEEVIEPTLSELADRGIDYCGFLYAGLMLTEEGPKVLEFNCRMGDPETQPLLFALEHDLVEPLIDAAHGELSAQTDLSSGLCACCVVLASAGYPSPKRDTGHQISGLKEAGEKPETKVFHAGTRLESDGFVNAGGRVLGVTGRGDTAGKARRRAYRAVDEISWTGLQYRKDIGE